MSHIYPPAISVVMPCYNNGAYVGQAIESVQKQTYGNWELVIVDDGSTDNSEEIIMHYAFADQRIRCIKQANAGAASARNHGVEEAKGELICFLDADDWLDSNCLQDTVFAFEKDPSLRLFYFKAVIIDEKTGRKTPRVGYGGSYRNVLVYGLYTQAAMRKEAFHNVGGFDVSMDKGFEDYEFYVRFLYKNCNVVESSKVLYYYRNYDSEDRVSSHGLRNLASVEAAIYARNIDKYVEYLGSPLQRYRYDDRFLPRLCNKVLSLKTSIYNWLH